VATLASQVDFAPTLLGLLNWSYASRFYGWDVRKPLSDPRALIGNYQKLGLYQHEGLTVLSPVRQSAEYTFNPKTFDLTPRPPQRIEETIAYYQTASYLYRHDAYQAVSAEDQAKYRREAGLAPLASSAP
jgi:hypothetical protein